MKFIQKLYKLHNHIHSYNEMNTKQTSCFTGNDMLTIIMIVHRKMSMGVYDDRKFYDIVQ